MGNCLSAPNESRQPYNDDQQASDEDVALGKNRRLSTSPPQWSPEERMTREEVESKRAEFWETSPAFEGRKEIWEALKAACDAFGNKEFELAQTIVSSAGISLPRGTLADVYDELGNRYRIPNYCLVFPPDSPGRGTSEPSGAPQSTDDSGSKPKPSAEAASAPDSPQGDKITLRIRLSSLKDVKISVRRTDTIATVKQKLGQMEGFDGSKVRIFLTGKILPDSAVISAIKIPKGFLLQAHVPASPS
ncbi:ubiquitin domain-containing protein 2-like [Sycon ciliatum]|uniref:ubiquitin domain-containing protein 2-like n=1 Tax=Sycon ciliatum TaxID=27933 RepID=UPI0031F67D43